MVEKKTIKKVVKKAAPAKKAEVKSVVKKPSTIKSKSSVTKKVTAKKIEKSSNQTMILSIILGLFIILSAFQAFQINNVKTQIEDGSVKITSSGGNSYSSSGSSSSSGNSATPSNIADLPQMVGGC